MHKKQRLNLSLLFGLILAIGHVAQAAQVAIIIDDIGYRATDVDTLALDKNITFSILPHTPFGPQLAEAANIQQRDIMLHIPMEATNGKFMGPGGLSSSMTKAQLQQSLEQSLRSIPNIIGINNHMGSKLTTLNEPMRWTMEVLKQHNLFFLDSKTSQASVADKMARRAGVPVLNRSVFLDNQLNDAYIERQFKQLIATARKRSNVIAIAHPHPETVTALKRLLPMLAEQGIALVPVSALLRPHAKKPAVVKLSDD